MKFGEKIRKARIQRGLTQEELSLSLGVTCRTLQNYESGNVYPKKREVYAMLAEFFDTDVNYWLSESQEEPAAEGKKKYANAHDLAFQVNQYFENNALTEEELDQFMRTVQGAYWAAKDRNKNCKKQ